MNFLTIIPISDIIPYGIPYLKATFPSKGVESQLETFWSYFQNNWMVRYPPSLWNFNEKVRDELINRTNNPLERFNRTLNEVFPTAHPNMDTFITTINSISARYVDTLHDIQHGRTRPPRHEPVPFPRIPAAYTYFRARSLQPASISPRTQD